MADCSRRKVSLAPLFQVLPRVFSKPRISSSWYWERRSVGATERGSGAWPYSLLVDTGPSPKGARPVGFPLASMPV
ncbi:hypothetical protein D3C73_842730 [compost metagenome]